MEGPRDFAILIDKVSGGGGYVAGVTARTRCEWIKLREYGEFLYCRRFPLKLKGPVYESYVRLAILYGSMVAEKE